MTLIFHSSIACRVYALGHDDMGTLSRLCRADCRLAPSQWEMALLCNDVSNWLGTNLESALLCEFMGDQWIFLKRVSHTEIVSFCYPEHTVAQITELPLFEMTRCSCDVIVMCYSYECLQRASIWSNTYIYRAWKWQIGPLHSGIIIRIISTLEVSVPLVKSCLALWQQIL